MDQVIQNQLISAAGHIEKQLDNEIDKLDSIGGDDLQKLRENRLKELKQQVEQKNLWLSNGHGQYTELTEEKEFFEISKKSPNIVCHFYRDSTERCRIVDMHMQILAKKHIEAKFCKINAEKSPFLTQRLRVKVIPTIVLVKDSKTKDFIVGFTDLGNRDDFNTDTFEWRIAQSGAIEYNGDLLIPPNVIKKQRNLLQQQNKTIRGGYDSDDSDIEFET